MNPWTANLIEPYASPAGDRAAEAGSGGGRGGGRAGDAAERCAACPGDGTVRHGRKFLRYRVSRDGTICGAGEVGGAGEKSIRLVDVSRVGLGFVCAAGVAVGSIQRVRFRALDGVEGDEPIGEQTVIIVHSHKQADGTHRVGAQVVFDPGLLGLLGVPGSALKHDGDAGCTYPLCEGRGGSEAGAPSASGKGCGGGSR
jgi:hypothetical protein